MQAARATPSAESLEGSALNSVGMRRGALPVCDVCAAGCPLRLAPGCALRHAARARLPVQTPRWCLPDLRLCIGGSSL